MVSTVALCPRGPSSQMAPCSLTHGMSFLTCAHFSRVPPLNTLKNIANIMPCLRIGGDWLETFLKMLIFLTIKILKTLQSYWPDNMKWRWTAFAFAMFLILKCHQQRLIFDLETFFLLSTYQSAFTSYRESFAIRKWFNCSFRKKLVVFRGRRRRWTENQFVQHERLKVVRATLSGTITLFTPPTTQWYFCNILPYLRRAFNFWLLWLRHFRAKFLAPRNFCLFACLNFKLVFLYLVPLDICVSRFLSPRTLPTEGYRKSKLGSIFHIQV